MVQENLRSLAISVLTAAALFAQTLYQPVACIVSERDHHQVS